MKCVLRIEYAPIKSAGRLDNNEFTEGYMIRAYIVHMCFLWLAVSTGIRGEGLVQAMQQVPGLYFEEDFSLGRYVGSVQL